MSLQSSRFAVAFQKETSKMLNLFPEKIRRSDPASFQGVCVTDVPIVEDLDQVIIFLYNMDIVDGAIIGLLARRSVSKHSNTVRQLRYHNHICYVSNINGLFEASRCPSCHQFNNKAGNLERHLTTCSERLKHVYPKNVYQLRETLFDKLDRLIFLIQTTKNTSTTWQFLILNQSLWEMKLFKIPRQRHGLGKRSQFR